MHRTYDDWKATDPKDREDDLIVVPCMETPKYDDYDICVWCGADPTQACKWDK